jgi:protein TonB
LIEAYEVPASPIPVITIEPVTARGSEPPFDAGVGTPSAGADAIPQVTLQGRPSYPFELRRASVSGQVLVDFFVKTDGTVANAVAISATDIRFAVAAVDAVRGWLFRPGRSKGQLVTTHMQVPIIFTLSDQ